MPHDQISTANSDAFPLTSFSIPVSPPLHTMSRIDQLNSVLEDSLQTLQKAVQEMVSAQTDSSQINNVQKGIPTAHELAQVKKMMSALNVSSKQPPREASSPNEAEENAKPSNPSTGCDTRAKENQKAKSFIIATHKEMCTAVLANTEAQSPIINLVDSGVVETYWGCVDDLLLFAQNETGFPTQSSEEEQLRFLEKRCVETSSRDGIKVQCEITRGPLICIRESYPSYQTMLKMRREDMEHVSAQLKQKQQKMAQQDMEMQRQQVELQLLEQQRNAILSNHQQNVTRSMQMAGATPMYYQDGVPHYGGFSF